MLHTTYSSYHLSFQNIRILEKEYSFFSVTILMQPFLILCIIALACAKYQFIAEKDIIDVVTVSKDEALRRLHSGDGPSYIMTKKRKQ